MKRIFPLLMLFLTATAVGQTSETTDEVLIKELIENTFQGIFSDLDLQALDVYLTEDFLLLETGEVWDMEKMRNYLKSAGKSQTKRVNSFDFIEIKIAGKMAWVAYYNTAEFWKGEEIVREMNWIESATAIHTEEGWKLQMLHSTKVKE